MKIRSTSLKLGKVLHDELRDILDIYPCIAPQQVKGAFGVYRRNSLKSLNTKDTYNYEEIAVIEIAIIAPTYAEALDKAINVKMYLEHLRGDVKTDKEEPIHIMDIRMTDASEEWSNDRYIQSLVFEISVYNNPEE